jgi:hypothetical protein
MPSKVYNGEAIRRMTLLFQPRSTEHFNWLIEKGHRELVEVVEFIKTGKEISFKWLIENQYFEVAAFGNAVRGDKNAFRWLMQNKSLFWASTANAINKDKEAMAWLRAHNFIVYADLAAAIIEWEKFDNDDFSGYYKAPI